MIDPVCPQLPSVLAWFWTAPAFDIIVALLIWAVVLRWAYEILAGK